MGTCTLLAEWTFARRFVYGLIIFGTINAILIIFREREKPRQGPLRDKGELPAAHELLEAELNDRVALLGDQHPDVAVSLHNLGLVLLDEGRYVEAVQRFEEALRICRATPDSQKAAIGRALTGLAAALHGSGEHLTDVARCQEALTVLTRGTPDHVEALGLLGRLHLGHGHARAAEPLLRTNLELLQQSLGPEHLRTVLGARALASCLTALRRFDEAEPLLLDSYPKIKTVFGDHHRLTVEAVAALIRLYTDWGKPLEAERYRVLLPGDVPLGEFEGAAQALQELADVQRTPADDDPDDGGGAGKVE